MQEMRENTATAQADLERQQQNFEQQSTVSVRAIEVLQHSPTVVYLLVAGLS